MIFGKLTGSNWISNYRSFLYLFGRLVPKLVLLLIIVSCQMLEARVVINELFYDPVGVDTGYEWIELYNAGEESINLEGARIQKAGSTFTTVFTFPHFVLRPGRFVVLGEAHVSQAAFTSSLAFQNSGAETDGVRYISPDGLYSDTVLYGSPNVNALVDDTGAVGSDFAVTVSPGQSLARIADGLDTDLCSEDFRAEANPSPGLPNHIYIPPEPIFPILNEIMYDPHTGNQEWIELFVESSARTEANFSIKDLANNTIRFSLPSDTNGYFVLTTNAANLQALYPECPEAAIIPVTSWAALNNDGDKLWLFDAEGAVLDSMSYVGNSAFKGISYERNEAGNWYYCTDPSGGTPGRSNSTVSQDFPSFRGKIHVDGSPANPKLNEAIRIWFQDFEAGTSVSVNVFDLAGRKVRTLADNTSIPESGYLEWNGRMGSGSYAVRGLYIILWESQVSGGRINRRQMQAVIK